MNVKIQCDLCGEMQFEMTEEKATQLIGQACMFSSEFKCDPELYEDAKNAVQEYAKQHEVKQEKPASKVERMFGDVKARIPISAVIPKIPTINDTYKGFMYIECEGCGSVRGYFAKNPQQYYHCACGHSTHLRNLKTMYPKCGKCGSTFKYMTNCDDPVLTYTCLDCGAPIDMELNSKGTTYVTVR